MITIRFATIADAELIATMSRQTFYETFASVNTKEDMDKFMNEQFTPKALMEEVRIPGNIFFIAYNDNEPVGYVRMRDGEKREEFANRASIEIARIYAVQSAIGKGVGKALMEKCIEVALTNKKEIIWLGVWEKNDRALRFYQQWGFEKFGEHDFILGNDRQIDWLLKKQL